MSFAIIETGGKQYKVQKGTVLTVEKLEGAPDADISFGNVLLVSDGKDAEIGTPYVKGKKVEASVVGQVRGEKKIVFKYHSKARERKKKGHRQHFTKVQIKEIPA